MDQGSWSTCCQDDGTDCVGLIGTSVMIADVSWTVVASASLLAGVVSVLTSIAGLPEVQVENTDLPQ